MIRTRTVKGFDRGFNHASTFDQLVGWRGGSRGVLTMPVRHHEFSRAAPIPSSISSRASVPGAASATSGRADLPSSMIESVSRKALLETNHWHRTHEIPPRSPVNVVSKFTISRPAQSRRIALSAVTYTAGHKFPRVRAASPCQTDPGNSA